MAQLLAVFLALLPLSDACPAASLNEPFRMWAPCKKCGSRMKSVAFCFCCEGVFCEPKCMGSKKHLQQFRGHMR